jgi:molybdopterin molybdotransferase
MINVREALDTVLRDVPLLSSEAVALASADGRVLASDVQAARDVPPFRNSAMDGFAVRADDTVRAAPDQVRLRVLETVGAGQLPTQAVTAGSATQIMTGAVMPEGADAVVKVEDTESTADGSVIIHRSVTRGSNVRSPGEDVRTGEIVLRAGRQLRPADIGLLASLGCATVEVRRQPRVAVLATGDELVDIDQALSPGKIVNSNAYILAAAVREAGAMPHVFGIIRDTRESLDQAFSDALAEDVVLSTGGVSMGVYDLVRETLARLGVEERFWKVAQKPGKPLIFGRRGQTLVFGLPGNPVSSLVCFYIYVRPAIRAMLGSGTPHLPVVEATADEDIAVAESLTEFVRCTLSGPPEGYRVRVTGTQSSGVLRSMSLGEALLISPPGSGRIKRGERARVILLAEQAASSPPV